MRNFLVVPLTIAVAACATPVAEPESSTAIRATEPVPAAEPAPIPAPAEERHINQQPDEIVAENEPTKSFQGIEDIESPAVDEVAPSMIPGRAAPETSIICERVYPTGSILPTKVCRDKSEIEKKQEFDQEVFDDIKRNTALGNSRL